MRKDKQSGEKQKKPYLRPRVIVYGQIADLTLSSFGSATDAMGPAMH